MVADLALGAVIARAPARVIANVIVSVIAIYMVRRLLVLLLL